MLLDVWLPGMDGLRNLERMRQNGHAADGGDDLRPRHHRNRRARHQARRLRFHRKAALAEEITLRTVRNAVEHLRLEEENQPLREELGARYQVIGESIPMKALRQQIALTAPTNGRVLIYGESGTGKELVARALHAASLRSAEPFVEVNCAAIPEELIESELFGHVKGSFTGASENKMGKFEKADSGTLFLDEVGDMSLRTQSKVLRVARRAAHRARRLQSGDHASTSASSPPPTRISTRKSPAALFPPRPFLPPKRNSLLRVRRCASACRTFPSWPATSWRNSARPTDAKPKELSEPTIDILMRYPWPGNVRELRNLIERLVIVCPQARIEPHHLPPELFREVPEACRNAARHAQEARSAYEREFILRKFKEHQWNMTQTAEPWASSAATSTAK